MQIRKAQSTLEYALLISVVVGALLTMQNYLKRSFMGKLQSVGDNIGDPYSPGHTSRIETMNMTAAQIVETTERGVAQPGVAGTVGRTQTDIQGGTQKSTSTRSLDNVTQEAWSDH